MKCCWLLMVCTKIMTEGPILQSFFTKLPLIQWKVCLNDDWRVRSWKIVIILDTNKVTSTCTCIFFKTPSYGPIAGKWRSLVCVWEGAWCIGMRREQGISILICHSLHDFGSVTSWIRLKVRYSCYLTSLTSLELFMWVAATQCEQGVRSLAHRAQSKPYWRTPGNFNRFWISQRNNESKWVDICMDMRNAVCILQILLCNITSILQGAADMPVSEYTH